MNVKHLSGRRIICLYTVCGTYVGVLISFWLSKGILFLQDNAAPHKASITHQKLAGLHFEALKHPAYSSDSAPSDYCLFPNLFIKPKTYQPPLVYPDRAEETVAATLIMLPNAVRPQEIYLQHRKVMP
jgi:hypothetical protein